MMPCARSLSINSATSLRAIDSATSIRTASGVSTLRRPSSSATACELTTVVPSMAKPVLCMDTVTDVLDVACSGTTGVGAWDFAHPPAKLSPRATAHTSISLVSALS